MVETDGLGFKSIKEINKFLSYNISNPPQIQLAKNLSLQDINSLKHSRDYLDDMFKKYTQTIRNDTYKPNIATCYICGKPKDTYKITCYECINK